MTATMQLDLFAPPPEVVPVTPTQEVIVFGARAKCVPLHQHVPSPRPKAIVADDDWLLALRVAEECIRWRSWTQPHPLPLDSRPDDCVGGAAGARGWYWHDNKGVTIGERGGPTASWPALLRGLREQREREPHVAEARDLAAAYKALESYDDHYIRDGDGGEWRETVAVPHFEKLKETIVGLGGDPDFLAEWVASLEPRVAA